MPQVDLIDQTWVRAGPRDLAAVVAAERLRRRHALRAKRVFWAVQDQLEAVSL